MYLSESYLKSKAKAKSLNVGPMEPHIHANLKFVCTTFVHFHVNVVCEGVWKLLSIIVGHKISPPTWILFCIWITIFFFFFFNFNIDVKFYPTDWELMGYRTRIGNKKKKRRSFLWSNTVPYLSCQSQIPLRCLIVMVLPISGLMAWNVWNTKTSWVWSSGQSKKKKAWNDVTVTGKLWKEIAFLWRCQYSSLAHYHYNS